MAAEYDAMCARFIREGMAERIAKKSTAKPKAPVKRAEPGQDNRDNRNDPKAKDGL